MENAADIWGAFFRTGSVLLFVIAVLVLLLYLLRRFSALKLIKPEQGLIKILEVHHFSPQEKLVLIDVLDEKILLGVTAQNIQTLAVIDKEIKQETITSPPPLSKSFARFFKSAIKGNKQNKTDEPPLADTIVKTTSAKNPSINTAKVSSIDTTKDFSINTAKVSSIDTAAVIPSADVASEGGSAERNCP